MAEVIEKVKLAQGRGNKNAKAKSSERELGKNLTQSEKISSPNQCDGKIKKRNLKEEGERKKTIKKFARSNFK